MWLRKGKVSGKSVCPWIPTLYLGRTLGRADSAGPFLTACASARFFPPVSAFLRAYILGLQIVLHHIAEAVFPYPCETTATWMQLLLSNICYCVNQCNFISFGVLNPFASAQKLTLHYCYSTLIVCLWELQVSEKGKERELLKSLVSAVRSAFHLPAKIIFLKR